MKNNEAKRTIMRAAERKTQEKQQDKTQNQSKVLKAMALGIAMALATTSVPMTAQAAEGDDSQGKEESSTEQKNDDSKSTEEKSGENKSEETKSESQKELSQNVSEAKEQADTIQDKLDGETDSDHKDNVENGEQEETNGEATPDIETVIEAGEDIVGVVETSKDGSLDEKITELEEDYEAVKAEYEEANEVVVEKSQELESAEEEYKTAKDKLLEVQTIYTSTDITANVGGVVDATENLTSTDAEKKEDAEAVIQEGTPIDTTSTSFANMLSAYKQSLLAEGTSEEDTALKLTEYLTAVNAYNESLLNYQKTVIEYDEASKNADVAYDKLVETVKEINGITEGDGVISEVDQLYGDELGEVFQDDIDANKQQQQQISTASNILHTIVSEINNQDSVLSTSINTYFDSKGSNRLDSEGLYWANGTGEGKLTETINTTLANTLQFESAEAFKAAYYWKITKEQDGSFTVYLGAKNAENADKQLVCKLSTNENEEVSASWTPVEQLTIDGEKYEGLATNKAVEYTLTQWEKFGDQTWQQIYDKNGAIYSEYKDSLSEESITLAKVVSEALQSDSGDLAKAINKFFAYKAVGTTMDSSGTNWANGNASGLGSVNGMIASLLNEAYGSSEWDENSVNEIFVWSIQKTGKNQVNICVTTKEIAEGSEKAVVYVIDHNGTAYISEAKVTEVSNSTTNNGVNVGNPESSLVCDTMEKAEKVGTIVKNYQGKLSAIINSQVKVVKEAANALLALQNAMNALVNAENKTVSEEEYREVVQDTLDKAYDYIAAIETAGTEADMDRNAIHMQQVIPDSGETARTREGGGSTGGGTSTDGGTVAVVNNLITELENALADTTIVEEEVPMAATPDVISSEEDESESGELLTISSSTTLAESDTTLTAIDDGEVALAGQIDTSDADLELVVDGEAALTAETQLLHKHGLWWLLLAAAAGAFGTGAYARKKALASEKKEEEEK